MYNKMAEVIDLKISIFDRKPDVRANITLTRAKPMQSGYRPAHLIGDYLTTGVHKYISTDVLNQGESAEGFITFLTPEAYPHSLKVGMRITFGERFLPRFSGELRVKRNAFFFFLPLFLKIRKRGVNFQKSRSDFCAR